MQGQILGMIWGAVALVIGQMGVALLAPLLVRPIRQKYALREILKDQDQYGVGVEYEEVQRPQADRKWCGPCRVIAISKGKIIVKLLDDKGRDLPFTKSASCREFIEFHPVKRLK